MSDLHSSRFTVFTCALAIAGWIIVFAGLCASHSFIDSISWWIIIFNLLVVGISCSVLWLNTARIYYPVVLTMIAISISYNTNEIMSYIGIRKSTSIAAVSGYIMLTISQFFWILVFGVQQEVSVLRSFSDLPYNRRYSSHKEYPNKVVFGHNSVIPKSVTATTTQSPPPPIHYQQQQQQQQQPNIINHPSPAHDRMVSVPVYMNTTAFESNTVYMKQNVEYNIQVTALHNYQASTDDPNELSFIKGEVLLVYEKKGGWWQAKKSNGAVGMIPSNYVIENAS